ncbi:MAG: hypothetical protein U0794_01370 [Isosphaeraceae bacterium]
MRVRRSLLNFVTMIVYTAVTAFVAIWSTPKLLHWLGSARFGGFRVIYDAYGYLSLLELGLGGALAPLLARAFGTGDDAAVGTTLAAGVRGYLRVTALTLLVGLAFTPLVPSLAPNLTGPDVVDLQRAWMIGLIGFAMLGVLPFRSAIEARQLGYVVNLLLIVQALMMTGLALTLAWARWGITGQAVAMVAASLVFNLSMLGVVRWIHPGLIGHAIAARPDPETRQAIRSLSWPTLMIHLSGRVSYLTDNMIVGSMMSSDRVTSLYNTQRLATLGQSILQSAGNAVWAGLAELFARGDRDLLNQRLVELTKLLGVLAVVGLGPVVAFNRAFVRLWLGLDGPDFVYGGEAVIIISSINVYFLAQMSLWNWLFSATGKVQRVAWLAVVGASANLAMSILFTSLLGLTGPLLGTTLAVLPVALIILPSRIRAEFGTSIPALLRATLLPLAWGVAATAFFWWLARRLEPGSFVVLGAEMSTAALMILALCAAFVLEPKERAEWRARIRALRPGPKSPAATTA